MVLKVDFERAMENAQDGLNDNFEQLNGIFAENNTISSVNSAVTISGSQVSKIINIGGLLCLAINVRINATSSYVPGDNCFNIGATLPANTVLTLPTSSSSTTSQSTLRCGISEDGMAKLYGTSTQSSTAVYIVCGIFPIGPA